MWSARGAEIVARLIDEMSPEQLDPRRTHAARLYALPIGGSMWADYYLRPSGEVVVVGEDYDRPDVESVQTDRSTLVRILVWGSRRYPALQELLPTRPPGAVDCQCRVIPLFAEGKVLCSLCDALGWVPT